MQGKQLTMLLGVLYGGAFLVGFNENLMNMGLIAIMDEFVIDSVTAQWLVTAFMIASTLVVMCMAFFYRRIRLRVLFFAASALTLVGSVLGLFSTNFGMLLIARIIQAVFGRVHSPYDEYNFGRDAKEQARHVSLAWWMHHYLRPCIRTCRMWRIGHEFGVAFDIPRADTGNDAYWRFGLHLCKRPRKQRSAS